MNSLAENSIIKPDWPAPESVNALFTTRHGGSSKGLFQGFNLASHVGDQAEDVDSNRRDLAKMLGVEGESCWISQVHGNGVIEATNTTLLEADAHYTTKPDLPIAVLVADCLPVLLCDMAGTCVAAVHAGWRGLACGVLRTAVKSLADKDELMAWMGPAIGPCHFEVGPEVRAAFPAMMAHFTPADQPSHWMMDMWAIAAIQLNEMGVTRIYSSRQCTYCDAANFYSYRRDGGGGRMAAVAWLSRYSSL
jgi:YfiH family protein